MAKMRIGNVLGISLQTELLVLSFLGIMCTVFDTSLLEFNSNLNKIWHLKLDPSKFSERAELYMKYTLCGNLLVRTFTVHIYLGTYIIMLYPLLFNDRPRLVIPWMAINMLKCIGTGFVSFVSGAYVCMMYRWMKPPCWEFVLSIVLNYGPAVYMFSLVLTFYKDLTRLMKIQRYNNPIELKARRRRARLLADSQHSEQYSSSFEGLAISEREFVDYPSVTMQNHVSISTLDEFAFNRRVIPNWQETDVNKYLMRDAAVSGRSFRVSGSVLEVLGRARSTMRDKILEPEGTDQVEEVQNVCDLDSHETTFQAPKRSMLTVQTQAESTDAEEFAGKHDDYNTVSDLLNDVNIAMVLNIITGKDEPFESDLSKLDNYEITITEEDPLWAYVSYDPTSKSPQSPKKKMPTQLDMKSNVNHEVANQVSSPHFDHILAMPLAEVPDSPQKDASIQHNVIPLKLSDTRMGKLYGEKMPAHLPAPMINQLYRNQAAYVTSYRDDGYTQALLEKMINRQGKKI